MPLLRINATATGLSLHDTRHYAALRLRRTAEAPGPAIVMIHGYKYAPGSAKHCPHAKIFRSGKGGWPARLGFGSGNPAEGLGIAFGWYARGSLAKVHHRARQLGESLATVVAMRRAHRPERPVHIIAHSLGAEIALSALAYLPHGAIDRIILLAGATQAGRAREMLATPAGRSAEVLNVVSRENDLFDALFERLVPPEKGESCAIGGGIAAPNAVTLQLDCGDTLQALAQLHHEIAAPDRRVCHWSAYQRRGAMQFYARFLRDPASTPLDLIRRQVPARPARRWTRLLPNAPKVPLPPIPALPVLHDALGWLERLAAARQPRRKPHEPAH